MVTFTSKFHSNYDENTFPRLLQEKFCIQSIGAPRVTQSCKTHNKNTKRSNLIPETRKDNFLILEFEEKIDDVDFIYNWDLDPPPHIIYTPPKIDRLHTLSKKCMLDINLNYRNCKFAASFLWTLLHAPYWRAPQGRAQFWGYLKHLAYLKSTWFHPDWLDKLDHYKHTLLTSYCDSVLTF